MTWRFGGVLVSAMLVAATACTRSLGDGDAASADGGLEAPTEAAAPSAAMPLPYFVEPCSNAPRWPNGTDFSYEHGGPSDAGPCTPHCGPNASASALWGPPMLGKLTSAALPSGPCAHDGNTCTMAAEWLGPCPDGGSAVGPFDLFICRCTSGAWTCTIDDRSPSVTEQTCTLPDDAGTD